MMGDADLHGWRFTHHAIERMHQMALTPQQVVDCLERPQLTYPQRGRYDGKSVAIRDAIAVCHNPVDRVIVSIFPNTIERYSRDDGKGGMTSLPGGSRGADSSETGGTGRDEAERNRRSTA